MADTQTRVLFHQDADQVGDARDVLGLSEAEADLLPRLVKGRALWKVADRTAVVAHRVADAEWVFARTDTRMTTHTTEGGGRMNPTADGAAYEGDWDLHTGEARVRYDPGDGHLEPVERIVRHSPDGLAWGYGGSGPADTALTILTHAATRAGHDPTVAGDLYQAFKRAHVATLDLNEPFRLPAVAVDDWLAANLTRVHGNGRSVEIPAAGIGPRLGFTIGPADLQAWERRLSALETRLLHRAATIEDNMTAPWGGNATLPDTSHVTVPAGPVRDQILAVMADTGDSLDLVARGLGLNHGFAADLVDGRIGELGPLEIATVCHALHCTPYDLWPPATVEQILTVYPPDLWPRETIPLTPTTPTDPAVTVEPAQPTLGPELTR